jgi:hypothetical protein
MRKETRILLLTLALSFFLVWALGSHPYSYYMNLRNAILFGGGYLAYELRDQNIFLFLVVLILALFNPISPFRFERDTWAILNIIAAVSLLSIAWKQIQLLRG